MGLNFNTPYREKEIPPEGQTTGRIYSVIDWGVQTIRFADSVKHMPKLSITWELPNRKMKDGRPFVVSQAYTTSLNPKSKMLPLLKSMFGLRFKVEEKDGHASATLDGEPFDASMLLNTYCKVAIVHNESNGVTYANIHSVSQMPEPEPGDPPVNLPPAVNPNVYFDLDHFDVEIFNGLNKYHQEKIKASQEWKKIHPAAGAQNQDDDLDTDPYAGMPEPDDIPF